MNDTNLAQKPQFVTWLQLIAIGFTLVILLLTGGFLWLQTTWVNPQLKEGRDAFFHGTIGTEIMPQPVFEALPDLLNRYL